MLSPFRSFCCQLFLVAFLRPALISFLLWVKLIYDMFRSDPALDRILNPTPEELEGLENSIRMLREGSRPTQLPAFQLAAAQISHSNPDYIKEGLEIMGTLALQLWSSMQHERRTNSGHANHAEEDAESVELLSVYYYYMAIAHIKQQQLPQARSVIHRMLELKPDNTQGLHLLQYVDDQEHNNGMKGLITAATAIGAGLLAVGMMFRRR